MQKVEGVTSVSGLTSRALRCVERSNIHDPDHGQGPTRCRGRRDLVRRWNPGVRPARCDATDAEGRQQRRVRRQQCPSLVQRVAGTSLQEIDNLIGELQSLRDYISKEGERVQREITGYAQLNHAALTSARIISDSMSKWKDSLDEAKSSWGHNWKRHSGELTRNSPTKRVCFRTIGGGRWLFALPHCFVSMWSLDGTLNLAALVAFKCHAELSSSRKRSCHERRHQMDVSPQLKVGPRAPGESCGGAFRPTFAGDNFALIAGVATMTKCAKPSRSKASRQAGSSSVDARRRYDARRLPAAGGGEVQDRAKRRWHTPVPLAI